jgi:hypothetical protein
MKKILIAILLLGLSTSAFAETLRDYIGFPFNDEEDENILRSIAIPEHSLEVEILILQDLADQQQKLAKLLIHPRYLLEAGEELY